MAARASLLADGDEPIHRTGHRAAHEQEIALGVDLDDAQADLGEVAGAHVAGHPLSFDNPRRVRARRDRSRLAVARVAVGLGAAAKVMAVHDALKAAALRDAADLHAVALGEDRHRDRAPGGRGFTRDLKATDDARRRLDTGFLRVAR